MLTVVVPAFNEENSVKLFYERITDLFAAHKKIISDYEVVFVDDGSADGTWEQIKILNTQDPKIHGIRFSRNFGKEAAIFAGLHKAQGDCAVIMDCDLQHPPEYIPEMFRYHLDGYQIVRCVKKQKNKESFIRRICNSVFYRAFSFFDSTQPDIRNASDFQLIDRKVIDYILQFQETSLFFRGISGFVGFRAKEIEFNVPERIAGTTKWSYYSLISYAFSNIVSFSSKPLQIVTFNGLVLLFIAIILSIRTLYIYFINEAAPGITTVIILLLFIGSMLMISLGVIGFYIGKIFDEVKHRPRYIVDEEK